MSNLIGPRDHITWLSVNVRLDGVTEVRWALPNGEVRMTVQMTAGPTLLQRTWDLLDAEMNAIIANQFGDDDILLKHKTRARAIAEVLAMFMVPHFSTPEDIAREAQRRHLARVDGDTEYETPGLGSRRYEPPAAAILERADEARRSAKTKTRVPRTPRTPQPSGKRIPDQAVETSKQGISTGMFTPAQIGQMYGMTAAEVKAQLGLD